MGDSAGFYIYGIFRLYKVYFDNLKSHLFWINVLTANSYMYLIWEVFKKMAIYCPQGSGTLRQQLLMIHGIAWYCMVLHCIA